MGFPSTRIRKKLFNLHSQGVDLLDMTTRNIARISEVKLKDVVLQLPEINNYIKHLQNG